MKFETIPPKTKLKKGDVYSSKNPDDYTSLSITMTTNSETREILCIRDIDKTIQIFEGTGIKAFTNNKFFRKHGENNEK